GSGTPCSTSAPCYVTLLFGRTQWTNSFSPKGSNVCNIDSTAKTLTQVATYLHGQVRANAAFGVGNVVDHYADLSFTCGQPTCDTKANTTTGVPDFPFHPGWSGPPGNTDSMAYLASTYGWSFVSASLDYTPFQLSNSNPANQLTPSQVTHESCDSATDI